MGLTRNELTRNGWTIIFRDNMVIAHKGPLFVNALRQPNDSGAWMDRSIEAFQKFTLTGEQKRELEAVRKLCYCSSLGGSVCDFCGQTRRTEVIKEAGLTESPRWHD